MHRLARLAFTFLALAGMACAQSSVTLKDGEQFVYHVGWGIFFGAGQITISATDVHGPAGTVSKVDTVTATRGLVHGFFPFNATGESLFNSGNGLLLASSETSQARDKQTRTSISLDYDKRVATYLDDLNPERSRKIPIPEGNPADLIIALIQSRTWNLKVGQSRDILALFEDQFYLLTVHATGFEDVETPMGTYHTLVLEPKMEKTPPKGMFKRGSGVRVWIAQDGSNLPVRFSVAFKFGTGVANLVNYRPPTGTVVASNAQPHP